MQQRWQCNRNGRTKENASNAFPFGLMHLLSVTATSLSFVIPTKEESWECPSRPPPRFPPQCPFFCHPDEGGISVMFILSYRSFFSAMLVFLSSRRRRDLCDAHSFLHLHYFLILYRIVDAGNIHSKEGKTHCICRRRAACLPSFVGDAGVENGFCCVGKGHCLDPSFVGMTEKSG